MPFPDLKEPDFSPNFRLDSDLISISVNKKEDFKISALDIIFKFSREGGIIFKREKTQSI